MSTRSAIGIKENGVITAIYSHSDGYPEYVGRLLKEYYNSVDAVQELISKGDMSILKEKINPDIDRIHNFENRQEGVCVFYHRDRGESWADTKPMQFNTEQEFMQFYSVSYYYLFDNGIWCCRKRNSQTWVEL